MVVNANQGQSSETGARSCRVRSTSQSNAVQHIREARIGAQVVVSGIDLQVSQPGASAGIGFFQPRKRAVQVAQPGIKRRNFITVRLPLGFESADSKLQESSP